MRSYFARRILRRFNQRYGYDTSYLDMLLRESPAAFFKFAPLMKASRHREVVPIEASFAAGLVGARAEDCGPCLQTTVVLLEHAGIEPRLLLGHLVGLVIDAGFDLEVLRHQFDHAGDQVFYVGARLDDPARDEPVHQMVRQCVDLRFAQHLNLTAS